MNDGEFRLAAIEQRQGIDHETRNDVELHLRPKRPIGIHGRHEPVEAVVALHRNPQRSGMTLRQARHVPAGLGHLGQHCARQGEQALADGGEAQRPDVFLHQRGAVVAFQRFELVRQGGLGQEQPRGRL